METLKEGDVVVLKQDDELGDLSSSIVTISNILLYSDMVVIEQGLILISPKVIERKATEDEILQMQNIINK